MVEIEISGSNVVSGILVDPLSKCSLILTSEVLVAFWVVGDGHRHYSAWSAQTKNSTDDVAKGDWMLVFNNFSEEGIRYRGLNHSLI